MTNKPVTESETRKKGSIVGKIFYIIANIIVVFLAGFAMLLFFSYRWMNMTWKRLSIDELLFQLTMPLEGTGGGMVEKYLQHALLPTIIGTVILIVLFLFLRKAKKLYRVILVLLPIASILFSVYIVHDAWVRLGADKYFSKVLSGPAKTADGEDDFSDDFIAQNYANPEDTTLTFPEQKRNLIYIFLESMEMTYADTANGGAFEENVIPELTQLSEENVNFSGDPSKLNGGISYPGSTWTIGAMFAQSSGLPLQIDIGENNMNTQETFFPGITTLGDILEDNGYNNTLMIGSDATFGGRRVYYSTHGDYNIEDYNYAVEQGWIPSDYRVWWGYEDEKMIANAKNELTRLSQEDQPFNFTMLTVDTHFEDGYVCDICPDTFGDNQYANVMACSSKQIYDLIEWIKQQDFYDNTTIVISGDHPTMDSDFCNDVPEDYQRRVYTAYINPAAEIADPTRERQFSTFDQFPTTLAAMGVQINGDRLGLGTNLFSDVDTLTEKYGYEKNYDELSAKSLYMQSIADLSLDNEALSALRDSSVSGKMTTTMTSEQAHSYYFRFSDLTCSAVNKIRPSIVKVWTGDTEEDEENAVTFTSSESTDGSFHHLLLTREMLIAAGIQDPSVVHVKGYAVDVNGLEYEIASLTLEFPEPTLANGEPKQEGRFYLMDEFGNVINDDTVPADEEVEADSTDDSDLMPEEKQGLSENPEIFTEMPDSGQ